MSAIAAHTNNPGFVYCELADLYCTHGQDYNCASRCTGVEDIPAPATPDADVADALAFYADNFRDVDERRETTPNYKLYISPDSDYWRKMPGTNDFYPPVV